jgi:3D (Asp-Asp-Asp) domain-containing protein
MTGIRRLLALCGAVAALSACAYLPEFGPERELEVVATAYNSLRGQTDRDPSLTAFGVRLRPGMRVIAVSRDLYGRGLREGTRVRIEGLPGEWEVADRMASRWRNKIDVYMGEDENAARRFGVRRVKIQWREQRGGSTSSGAGEP